MGLENHRLCWCYEHAFVGNPIALQVIRTLAQTGWTGVLVDKASLPMQTNYLPAGFEHRLILLKTGRLGFIEGPLRFLFACLASRVNLFIASQPYTCLPAWIIARMLRVPVIYHTYELIGEEMNCGWRGRLFARVERFLLRRVDGVIVCTEEHREIYVHERGAPVDRIWVVHNILSPHAVPRHHLLRDKLRISSAIRRLILYTGALQSGRCIPETIEAFARLRAPDTNLVFVGCNTEEQYWERVAQPVVDRLKLSGRVHWAGWFEPLQLPHVISEADVGVVMYAAEPRNNYHCTASRVGFYISQGVPVIVPPYPYIARLVRDNGIGVVAEDVSVLGIAAAMEKALHLDPIELAVRFDKTRKRINWANEARTYMRALYTVCNYHYKNNATLHMS